MELANLILKENNKAMTFMEIYDRICEEKEISDDQKTEIISQVYADFILSAKFIYVGDDEWDIKGRQAIDLWDKDGAYYDEYPDYEEELSHFDDLDEFEEDEVEIEEEEDEDESIYEKDYDDEDIEDDVDDLDDDLEDEFTEDFSEDDDEENLFDEFEEEDENLEEELDEDYSYDLEVDDDDFEEEEYNEYMDDYEKMYDE
jgi:DNA-directed RNA polymerase subunit delta